MITTLEEYLKEVHLLFDDLETFPLETLYRDEQKYLLENLLKISEQLLDIKFYLGEEDEE